MASLQPVRDVTVLSGNTAVCNSGTVTVEVLSSSQSTSVHPSVVDKVRNLAALICVSSWMLVFCLSFFPGSLLPLQGQNN